MHSYLMKPALEILLDVAYQYKADVMIAGGRNMYTAYKARMPFVEVNQEREHAFAGFAGT